MAAPRGVHEPGKVIAALATAVALGRDCLADIAVLREQPEPAGSVASDPVVSRLVAALATDRPLALKAIRAVRAAAREQRPRPDGALVTIALDATIVIAHSPAPTWKKTYGHPMAAWADRAPEGSGEPLAITLGPGNAGSDTVSDHVQATRLALAQLSRHLRLASVGMTITEGMQDAIGEVPS